MILRKIKTICLFFFQDELDKTLAEYDTTHEANGSAQRQTNEQEIIAIANKTKLLANDANAASIRTR